MANDFTIRPAVPYDLPRIMPIFDDARRYMRQNGNMEQWSGGYPSADVIRNDIDAGHFFLCLQGNDIAGVFCFFTTGEPTYSVIYEGRWPNDEPYGVIHRIAVAKHRCGVASFCYDWCLTKCHNLRIDTHRDNVPMQQSLQKNGFAYCGIIHLVSGDERLAYHKTATK